MASHQLFSTRQQALRTEPSEVLTYDQLPQPLRVQIVHIVRDAMGADRASGYSGTNLAEQAYKVLHDILCREYGIFELSGHDRYEEKMVNFILMEKDIERVLDAVELCIRFAKNAVPEYNEYLHYTERQLDGQQAIDELNERFKQHAIGYRYEIDRIIKVDSTYIHSEIVKPTLHLLFKPKFTGANEEYLKAHEHYRHGRNKECLTECLKAFESTLKIICTEKGWAFNSNDTSRALVNVILSNNLVPTYIQSQLTSLRSLLESGIPTIRNRLGGHGQGASLTHADDETTRYGLNLTGSNLIYLIELSGL